jgi:hypothetical protein
MSSRGDMPHPQCVFSHNPDHGSLFPVAKKKLAGKPQRFEEQKKGLIAPMKDLKIMAGEPLRPLGRHMLRGLATSHELFTPISLPSVRGSVSNA